MIYYADGSTFDGPPEEAPRDGVLGIHQPGTPEPNLSSRSWYCFFDGRWRGIDLVEFVEHHRLGHPIVHGRQVSDAEWSAFLGKFLHT